MTKYLVKIISICSFIVLIPIIIAGVALSAVGSSLFKLNTYIYGATSDKASYSITIGEEGKDKKPVNEASFTNGVSVNVNIETVGYDFLGWFNGDDKTINIQETPVSTDASYTFEIKNNTQLTAAVKVKSYNIRFSGKYEDETTDITTEGGVYQYGDKLPVLTANSAESKSSFLGWRVQGTEQEPFDVANFAESTKGDDVIVLVPVWSSVRVEYKTLVGEDWIVFHTGYYTERALKEFTLLAQNDAKVVEAVGKGYKFVDWVDENGLVVTEEMVRNFTYEANAVFEIRLKKEVLDYTLNVQQGVNDTSAQVSFNINDGFGEVALTRQYYKFTGIKLAGKTYTLTEGEYLNETEKLSDVIIYNYNASQPIEATAVWACEYPLIDVTYSARGTWDGQGRFVYGKVGETYQRLCTGSDGSLSLQGVEFNDETGYKLEDNMLEKLVNPSSYEGFYIRTEGNNYVQVELSKVYVYVESNGTDITELGQDFAFAIEMYKNENKFNNKLTITFEFKTVETVEG